jgi:oxygen-independent coproporphyrinogen-3 oxidase
MYALPEQTLVQLEQDMQQALALAPPHLSIYHLTIEPQTYFAQHPPKLPDDELAWDMLDLIQQKCALQGLHRYEVSAFSRKKMQCTHNRNYWEFGDYLGIGAGAHSKISTPQGVVRQVRTKEPMRYMEQAQKGLFVMQEHRVTTTDLPFEFMLGALRLVQGFTEETFEQRTGLPITKIRDPLQRAMEQGLLERIADGYRPTIRGLDMLNNMQLLFLQR